MLVHFAFMEFQLKETEKVNTELLPAGCRWREKLHDDAESHAGDVRGLRPPEDDSSRQGADTEHWTTAVHAQTRHLLHKKPWTRPDQFMSICLTHKRVFIKCTTLSTRNSATTEIARVGSCYAVQGHWC